MVNGLCPPKGWLGRGQGVGRGTEAWQVRHINKATVRGDTAESAEEAHEARKAAR